MGDLRSDFEDIFLYAPTKVLEYWSHVFKKKKLSHHGAINFESLKL